MKNVLITGNKGYIGQHLWKIINNSRPDINLFGIDIQDSNSFSGGNILNKINCQHHFHTVIHLAALVRVGESVKFPAKYFDTNVNGTMNLLESLNYDNFIFASTGAAKDAVSPYGLSKRMAEMLVEKNGGDFTIFRFYNVIGTDGFAATNPEGLMLALEKSAKTKQFTIFGKDYATRDGTCIREYVHVNDVCKAIIMAIDQPANSTENLAYGDAKTTKEIVDIFLETNNLITSYPGR